MILIIGAGFGQIPAIKKAKELGLQVIVIDKNPKAPGMKLADKAYAIDVLDEAGAIKIACKHKISGVMTIQTDLPMPTVGAVTDTLNLKGVSKNVAERCSNKIKTRLALKEANVSQPIFFIARNLGEAIKNVKKIGYPCIIKAPDSSGSRGVVKVKKEQEIEIAFKEALKYSRGSEILIEEYIKGLEVGAQTFSVDGKCIKVLPHNDTLSKPPFMIPTGHSFPIKFSGKKLKKIKKICADAVESLGITDGPANVDMIIDEFGDPKIIEIGARIGATCLPELVQYHTGIDWVEQAILCSMGKKVKLKEKYLKPVAAVILESSRDGLLKKYIIPKNVLKNKKVYEIEITTKKGSAVNKLRKGTDRIGKVIVTSKNVSDAEKYAEKIKSKIIFEIL